MVINDKGNTKETNCPNCGDSVEIIGLGIHGTGLHHIDCYVLNGGSVDGLAPCGYVDELEAIGLNIYQLMRLHE